MKNFIRRWCSKFHEILWEPVGFTRLTTDKTILAFGIIVETTHPIFYLLSGIFIAHSQESLWWRGTSMLLALPFFSTQFRQKVRTQGAQIYLLGAVFFMLPFGFIYLYFLNGLSGTWLASCVVMIFVLHGLTDWRIASVMIGVALASNIVLSDHNVTNATRWQGHVSILLFAWFSALVMEATKASLKREHMRARLVTMNILAHEFRTPLAQAALLTQGIAHHLGEGDAAKNKSVQSMVNKLDAVWEGMNEMINSMSANACLSAVRGISKYRVDTAEIIKKAIESHERLRPETGIITTEMEEGCFAYVESTILTQVMSNLLSNAFKALAARPTRKKLEVGDVHVTVRCLDERDRKVVHIRVTDKGVGVHAQDIKHIFVPFYITQANRIENMPRHGMGLAMCRSALAEMQGRIRCASRWGEGATLTITLPFSAQKHERRGEDRV